MKQLSANASSIREHNLSLVLNLIWKAGSISRTEIIRETNLSATAVSALVNVLIQSGFVTEAGMGESSGGRRPVLLEFDYNCRMVLGVDLGASHITVIAMNLNGQTVASEERRYPVVQDPHGSLELIRTLILSVMRTANLNINRVLGIGVTCPAPLDGEKLDHLMTYYMPAWEGIVLPDELQKQFDVPVYLDNDANAGAIAEKWWGIGKKYASLAFIKLGIGVGSGLVINGEIYRGDNGAAGEIGHTTIQANGRRCRCGNYGCMESYVGVPGIIAGVVEARSRRGLPALPAENLTIDQIVSAAHNGDEISREVIANAGNYLGVAVANLINLMNPGLIVLGGELVKADELLFEAVRATVKQRVLPIKAEKAPLVATQLGADVIAVGAATLAIQFAFRPEMLYHTLKISERR